VQLTLVSTHQQQPPEPPIVSATPDDDLVAALDAVYEQLVAHRATGGRRVAPQEQFEVWQADPQPKAQRVRLGTLTIQADPGCFEYREYRATDAEEA
jgi:hypothetical protein